MPNGFHTYKEWEKLTPEIREYATYEMLVEMKKDIADLKSSGWKKTVLNCFSSFAGGCLVVAGYISFFKGAIK